MTIQTRTVQYTVDDKGKGDLLGVTYANQPGLRIEGNGTLQDPLHVVVEPNCLLVDLPKLRAWASENENGAACIRAILAAGVA